MIRLAGVHMHRQGERILAQIDWEVSSGEHAVVLGPNGSGKTALLQVLTGYMQPSGGKVEVLGHRRGRSDVRSLRRRIGWVSTALGERLHGRDSALDVVTSGRFATIGLWEPAGDEDYRDAREALAFMGCEHIAHRAYAVLSQGEKQRILIARALVSHPELLILDEPCGGLDPAAREHVLSYIEKLSAEADGPTLIYVTHHVEEIIPVFSRVSVMKAGRILVDGSPQAVLTGDVLTEAYGIPLEVERREGRYWVRTAGLLGAPT
ncbi:MAG: ABC transporter ATP-binding protein [Spirochaetaceae bacterium]